MQYRNSSMDEGSFYTYWYEKNLQGDVVAVYNAAGVKLISYEYDAWGNTVATVNYNVSGTNVHAMFNPFRYRGYYYDTTLNLYYLNSRYYDPATGRFINADHYISTGQGMLCANMFVYCSNSPQMFIDMCGDRYTMYATSVAMPYHDFEPIRIYKGDVSALYRESTVFTKIENEDQVADYYDIISKDDYERFLEFTGPLYDLLCLGRDLGKLGTVLDALLLGNDISSIFFNKKDYSDSKGRPLYIETGYVVVSMGRIYIGDGYSETETQYVILNHYKEIIYSKTIRETRITD